MMQKKSQAMLAIKMTMNWRVIHGCLRNLNLRVMTQFLLRTLTLKTMIGLIYTIQGTLLIKEGEKKRKHNIRALRYRVYCAIRIFNVNRYKE